MAQQAALFAQCLNFPIDEFLHDNQNIKNIWKVASCFSANVSPVTGRQLPTTELQAADCS